MSVRGLTEKLNTEQSIWSFLLGLLCGMFVLFGFCPFACAAYICFATVKKSEYAAATGALLGMLLKGAYTSIPPLVICVIINTIWSLWQGKRIGLPDRAIMLCIGGLCELFTHNSDIRECILTVCMCAVSELAMLIMINGIRTLARCIRKARLTSDSEVFYIAVFTAFIHLLLSSIAVSRISAASIFAGIVIMLCAFLHSMQAICFSTAAAVGAGFVIENCSFSATTAGLLTVVCILCSLVGRRGRYAVAAVYAATSVLLSFTSVYRVSVLDALLAAAIFLCIPMRFIDRISAGFMPRRAGEALKRADAIAKVTEGMSIALDSGEIAGDRNFAVRQFGAVSELLGGGMLRSTKPASRIRIEVGMACIPKDGCACTGDSIGRADFMEISIVAVSDGMGSGIIAHNESSACAENFIDMQKAGFSVKDSIDYANRRLQSQSKGEFYATLDAVVIDRETAEATIVKTGAPPSFMLRGGKVRSFCGESLPLGILEQVSATVHKLHLQSNDMLLIFTDGVHDALKSDTVACIIENIHPELSAKTAADTLLDAASANGANDDMSVVCIKIHPI